MADDFLKTLDEVLPPGRTSESLEEAKATIRVGFLHLAIKRKDLAVVKALLKAGTDPNARDDMGWTPLQQAMDQDGWENQDIVAALLEGGADPIPDGNTDRLSDDNDLGSCFLDVLVRTKQQWLEQHAETVEELERAHNEACREAGRAGRLYQRLRDRSGMGHEEAMKLVNGYLCPEDRESTPLHDMVYDNNLAAITALLNAGADPNWEGNEGQTPLHWAVDTANTSLPVLVTLLAAGADPNASDDEGETPLYHAVDRSDLASVVVLLNWGADPNYNSDGTFLRNAIQGNNLAVLAALLMAGANPNAQDDEGKTPLHLAAASDAEVERTLWVVAMLLKKGADPGVQDWHYGWDPVQEADHNEEVEDNQKIVVALLEGGPSPSSRSTATMPKSG